MTRIFLTALAVTAAVLGVVYQLYLKQVLEIAGWGRVIEEVGSRNCKTVPELQACDKIALHHPTGILYLACSTPYSRTQWTPSHLLFNDSSYSHDDYVATYDPKNSRITRLKVSGLPQGLSVHRMDVVPSAANSKDIFVYMVNHQPYVDKDPAKFGADSTIEIFKTRVGASTLTHLHTIRDPILISPHDVVGSPDGKSFHFTNSAGATIGAVIFDWLTSPTSSIGYCHVNEGCKFATPKINGARGIARANDTVYISNPIPGTITVLELQSDNSLVLTDVIQTDQGLAGLSIDDDGMLWAAGVPSVFALKKHFSNPSIPAPSSALRISLNTGQAVFYGHKYKVEKVFENGGDIASGTKSVVHDSKRGRLFLHGLLAPHLTVCKL